MPAFVWLARFGADFKSLTPAQQAGSLAAVEQFVEDPEWRIDTRDVPSQRD